jgi:hypothetical protein
MTNEQLDRVWEVINRAIDDRFGEGRLSPDSDHNARRVRTRATNGLPRIQTFARVDATFWWGGTRASGRWLSRPLALRSFARPFNARDDSILLQAGPYTSVADR